MWTAEQEAQLQYLNTVLSGVQSGPAAPLPVQQPSLLGRVGQQLSNLPSNIFQGLVNSGTGIVNASQPEEGRVNPYRVPSPYNVPAAQTTGQRLVDTGANLASGLGQFAISAAALGPVSRLAGLSGAGATIATDAATGAYQGIGTSPQESALSAAQFGGMGAVNALPLPWYVRGAMNAALGAGGQAARGQPLNSLDSAVQMAVPFIGTAAHDYFSGRGQPEAQQPAPPVQQPMFAPPTVPEGAGVDVGVPAPPDYSHLVPPDPPPRAPMGFGPPVVTDQAGAPPMMLRPLEAPPTVPQGQGVEIGASPFREFGQTAPEALPMKFGGPVSKDSPSILRPAEVHPAQTIADNLGVQYNGMGEGLHAFTDPQTGSTFHVPDDLLSPQLVADKLQAIRAPFETPGNIAFGSSTNADIEAAILKAQQPDPIPIKAAYDSLVKETGFPAVRIADLAARSGITEAERPAFHSMLLDQQAQGKAVLPLGDVSLSSPEAKPWALAAEPGERPSTLVRFTDPQEAKPILKQEVPSTLRKLAKSPTISEGDLATELRHYAAGERSAIQQALGSKDSKAETLASDLKDAYGPKGATQGSLYESNPSRGRTDEIDSVDTPEPPQTGMKAMRKLTGEAGFLDIRSPALQYLVGAGAGALLNPIVNRDHEETVGEQMLKGALFGAGVVAAARGGMKLIRAANTQGPKRILRDATETAKETRNALFTEAGQQKATAAQVRQEPTVAGAIVDKLRRDFGLDITPQIRLAMEKGLGLQTHLTDEAKGAMGEFEALKRPANPEEVAAADAFTKSKGDPQDIAALDRTKGVTPEFRDMLKVLKQVQIQGQKTLASAELAPRASLIEKTMGDYQSRAYQFFQDPVGWAKTYKSGKLDAAIQGVVSDLAATDEFKDWHPAVIENSVRDYLTRAQEGKPQEGAGAKIAASLFMRKKDLSPEQWRLMENLRGDQRLASSDRDIIKGMVSEGAIDGTGREALRQIAGSGQLDEATNQTLKDISVRETVSKNWRDLFGEYTDPVQRQAFTVQNILQSLHTAKTISELSDAVLPDGRKLAYSPKELSTAISAAEKAGDVKTLDALKNNYFQMESNTGYGKLSEKFVERGAMDALHIGQAGMDGAITPWWTKIQNILKLNATVLNPATHAHWWMQMPLMMSMARVYNPAMWVRAGKIVMGESEPEMNQEMKRLGIIGADFASRELRASNNAFSPHPLPESTLDKMVGSKDKFVQFMGKAYGQPDNIIRAAAYLTQKAKLAEEAEAAAMGRGLTGAPAKAFAEQYAQDQAAKFTNRYTINYGAIPPIASKLRDIPGFNPFMSYTSEMLRITKNFAEDMATGDSGSKAHAALNLGLMAGIPLALSLGSKAQLKPEDQDAWNRMQRLEPDYLKHSIKMVLGRDARGAFNYIDMAPVLPAGDFFSLAKEAAQGDWKTFISEQPLIGLDSSPLASMAMDFSRGENHITGQKLFTPGDYAALLWNAGTPPVLGTQLSRDIRAVTPNSEGGVGVENVRTGRTDTPVTSLLQHVGVRIASETFPAMLGNLSSDRQDKLDSAKQNMMQILRTNAGPDTKQDAILQFRNRAQEVNRSFIQKVQPE